VGVEKMPYRKLLEPILGQVLMDFGGSTKTRGFQEKRSVFKSQNYNISPIICYESIYGEYLTDYIKNGGRALAIITNDAWWGNTEGHRQHFSYAKLRAVETRKNIIRSANTGISGIISSRGDEIIRTNYNEERIISANYKENDTVTIYVQFGDYIYRISLFILIIIYSYYLSLKIKGKK
jgi:apolipoprotein N-acyltransferase